MQKISRKWWFWVGLVIVLVPAALYLPWYIPWKFEQWGIERLRGEEQAIWEEYEAENEALADAYRNDRYGGATPQKTLELFIEALEAKDYELASKYFVVEKQGQVKVDLVALGQSGNISTYLGILLGGQKTFPYQGGEKSEIRFSDRSGNQIHIEFFLLNPFTQKWKILE